MAIDPDVQILLDGVNQNQLATNAAIQNILDAVQTMQTTAGLHQSTLTTLNGVASTLTSQVSALTIKVDKLSGTVTPPPPPPPPPVTGTFPGDVAKGTIRWGCSSPNNGIPTAHETAAKAPVGVRRTFWQLSQQTSLLAAVKADVAAGRVPWVSVKPGTLWANVAKGTVDSQLTSLFVQLKAIGRPVWFSIHHEPEGGNGTPYPDDGQGTEDEWRAMQIHVGDLLNKSGAINVAYAPILMAWTFTPKSGRNPLDWWVPGIWDFIGIDLYQSSEGGPSPVDQDMWLQTLAFYKERGMRIAIGELGNKDHGPSGAIEMQDTYDHLIEIHCPGVAYFDTDQNGGKPLSGEALTKFRQLLAAPTSVHF
jgi:hypothetical protein